MPPRKQELSWEEKLSLIDQHQIVFKGCVPPRLWPEKYKHHFQQIRRISKNSFEQYGHEDTMDEISVSKRQANVAELCRRSYQLKHGISTVEAGWRDLENLVFERFIGDVICPTPCKGQRWAKPEYEANFLSDTKRQALDAKRGRRFHCKCVLRPSLSSRQPHHSDVFEVVPEAVHSHHPGDNLDQYPISMKPDRVIGLHMNQKYSEYIGLYPSYLEHCPVVGKRLIHPFLVVEAKQEFQAPGFRFIEVQTAFVIRRLLKSQDKLCRDKSLDLDPLVWFFAYRGDVWRLYAGVIEEEKVHIYDLWVGTIQSEDTALHLLQIVDFIWSWARDIYRPQIKIGIRNCQPAVREFSPTTTMPWSRATSAIIEDARRSIQAAVTPAGTAYARSQDVVQEFLPELLDATDTPFERLTRQDGELPNVSETVIQHANIVSFAFHILEIPNDRRSVLQIRNQFHESLLSIMGQNDFIIPFKRSQLRKLQQYWTQTTDEIVQTSRHPQPAASDDVVKAFIFFKSFLDPEKCQVTRTIFCLIWSAETIRILDTLMEVPFDYNFSDENLPMAQDSEISFALQRLRCVTGRESVVFAYKNQNWILMRLNYQKKRGSRLKWQLPEHHEIPELIFPKIHELFDAFARNSSLRAYQAQETRLLHILPTNSIPGSLPGRVLEDDMRYGTETGILVAKSKLGANDARFCLMLLMEQVLESKAEIASALQVAIKGRWLSLGEGALPITQQEKRILRDWVSELNRS